MKSGDIKQGAGRTVSLVPVTAAVKERAGQECLAHGKTLTTVLATDSTLRAELKRNPSFERRSEIYRMLADSTAYVEAWTYLTRSFWSATDDRGPATSTGMRAHYRFAAVRPGKYLVRSDMELFGTRYLWAVPITVTAGRAMKLDLTNENIATQTGDATALALCEALAK